MKQFLNTNVNLYTVSSSNWECFIWETGTESVRWVIKCPLIQSERETGFISCPSKSFYFLSWPLIRSSWHIKLPQSLLHTALTVKYLIIRKQEILAYHQSIPHVFKKCILTLKKDPITNLKKDCALRAHWGVLTWRELPLTSKHWQHELNETLYCCLSTMKVQKWLNLPAPPVYTVALRYCLALSYCETVHLRSHEILQFINTHEEG